MSECIGVSFPHPRTLSTFIVYVGLPLPGNFGGVSQCIQWMDGNTRALSGSTSAFGGILVPQILVRLFYVNYSPFPPQHLSTGWNLFRSGCDPSLVMK